MPSGSPSMTLLRGIVRQIWLLLALFVILFATYIALGRQFVPVLSQYREALQRELTAQLGVQVRIGALQGEWLGYEPSILMQDLQIFPGQPGDGADASLIVGRLAVHLDILRTLRDRRPVFRKVRIGDLLLAVEHKEQGWGLRGFPAVTSTADGGSQRPLIDWLLSQRDVEVEDVRLRITLQEAGTLGLDFSHAAMANAGGRHWLDGQAALALDGGTANLNLRIESRGDPFDRDDFMADLFLSVEDLQLEREVGIEGFDALRLTSLQGRAEVWAYLRNGTLDYAVGQLEVPSSRWSAGNGRLQLPISDGRTGFIATTDQAGGWVAELRGLHFQWREHTSRISRLRLAMNPQTRQLRFVSDRLALEPMNRLLVGSGMLGERLGDIMAELGPRGELENLQVGWELSPEVRPRLSVEANLAMIAVNAWKGAPAGAVLNGYLRATEQGGHVDLDSRGMALAFPDLFPDSWSFDTLQTRVGWQIRPESILVRSSLVRAELEGTPVRARFGLTLPRDREQGPPQLYVRVGIENGPVSLLPPLLPSHLLAEPASGWLLDAVRQGVVRRGGYLYHGALGNDEALHKQRSSVMFFDVRDAELAFHPDWPPLTDLSALVVGHADEIEIRVPGGTFMAANIESATARLPLGGDAAGRGLSVLGRATVGLAGARSILLDTPLREHVPARQMQQWTMSGQAGVDLDLLIPLAPEAALRTGVGVDISDGRLVIPQGDKKLDFGAIDGRLSFDLEHGLAASKLNTTFWGRPATAAIRTRQSAQGPATRISLRGRFAMSDLQAFTGQPIFSFLRGEAAYRARLDIPAGGQAPQLRVDSGLEGITLDMPPPLAKSAGQRWPLQFRMGLGEPQRIEFDLNKLLYGRFLAHEGVVGRGRLQFGAASDSLPERGVVIGGSIGALELERWLEFIPRLDARLKPAAGGEEASSLVHTIALDIDRLDLFGYQVAGSSAELNRRPEGWRVKLRNAMLDLKALVPADAGQPLDLHFGYLRLPGGTADEPESDPLAGIDPASLPAMNLRVDEFRIGETGYGSWRFHARPRAGGVHLSSIAGEFRRASVVSGDLDWTLQDGVHGSAVKLAVQAENVADVLQAWNFTPTLDSRKAGMDLGLAWSGSPARFDIEHAAGDIQVRLDRGQFYEIDPRASALRVFGVLNINTLARRLRMDFSDLFKKGLSYDTVRGNFRLHDGILSTRSALAIEGPSTKMYISGDADLVRETLDQKMIVTLPVTSNLPLAALIAGQPAIAGAIWLTEKLLGDRLERFASAQYLVSGPWDDPEVKLDRVFSKKD